MFFGDLVFWMRHHCWKVLLDEEARKFAEFTSTGKENATELNEARSHEIDFLSLYLPSMPRIDRDPFMGILANPLTTDSFA